MIQSVVLNIKEPETLETGVVFSQGDYGEEAALQILVKDNDAFVTDAKTAEISFLRSDGYIVTGKLTGSGGLYEYKFAGNELQSAGKAVATVTLTFDDGRVSTGAFAFMVRYNPMFDRGIEAGNYIWQLEGIIKDAEDYIAYLQKIIEELKPDIGSTALTKADLYNAFDQTIAGLKAADAVALKTLNDKICYNIESQKNENPIESIKNNWIKLPDRKTIVGYVTNLETRAGFIAEKSDANNGSIFAFAGNDKYPKPMFARCVAGVWGNSSPIVLQSQAPMCNKGLLTSQDLNTLNNIGTTGLYLQPANAQATTERNYPFMESGLLEVIPLGVNDFVLQRYTGFINFKMAIRVYRDNAWTDRWRFYNPT